MKKMLPPARAPALVLPACGPKPADQAENTAETAETRQVMPSDIAYVQVEAVLAQCDLYQTEGEALPAKPPQA